MTGGLHAVLPLRRSAPGCWSPPWSVRASWPRGFPVETRAIALLGNTIPTGAILVVLITILSPVSGAHLNPAVSLVFGDDAASFHGA